MSQVAHLFVALAIMPLTGVAALADDLDSSAGVTVPGTIESPILNIASSDPFAATNDSGVTTGAPASSSVTTITGPGTSASLPLYGSLGSGSLSVTPPSTAANANLYGTAPIDVTGTSAGLTAQQIAVQSDGALIGAGASDLASVEFRAAFCLLARANELNGAVLTADLSTICGGAPSTANATAAMNLAGAGVATGDVDGSICVFGTAGSGLPATAGLNTACGTNPSTAQASAAAASSDGTAISPALVASVCMIARAAATLPASAEFATVCSPQGTESAANATTANDASPAATNPIGSVIVERVGDAFGSIAGQALEFAGLPSSSTGGSAGLGAFLLGALGLTFLVRRARQVG